ncbi:Helicase conserved C-terminal domain [Ceratobasidium sp. AG-Ba]|nr:Helicase conserved C-terminal domain [Ceratobasidium sp. AG-Ba]QRW14232.1 Helicase conserved C-terminal domain [Ceratobasidium sp. AG-Ba]
MLAPLATDDPEEDMHSDILVDIEGEGDQIVDAAQGLVLDNVKLGQLKVPVASKLSPEVLLLANSFYWDWLWPRIKEYWAAGQDTNYALDCIDLPTVRNGAPDMTGSDGGFSCYCIVMQTLMNREGSVMDIVEQVMKRAGLPPGKSKVDDYEVLPPQSATGYVGLQVVDVVAETLFGPEALTPSGKVICLYAEVGNVLVRRAWERLWRKLKTAVGKSKELYKRFDFTLKAVEDLGTDAAIAAAVLAFQQWRVDGAEKTMEVEDVNFKQAESRLGQLCHELGYDMYGQLNRAGKRTAKKKEQKKRKAISKLATEQDIAASQDNYEAFCEALQPPSLGVEPGPAQNRFNLLEDYGDVGMKDYAGRSVGEMFADLGLPGATYFPFGTSGSNLEKPISMMPHQVAGASAILKRAFTGDQDSPALPTFLCNDVGLGKTAQLLGVIQMIAHMRQQQEYHPSKKLVPPPMADPAGNNTPYFAGLDEIPNLPHLLVMPRTLSDQWTSEIDKFTTKGSFQVVQYNSDQDNLPRFFSSGDYQKAAGADGRRAGRVIVIADQSRLLGFDSQAIDTQAKDCFEVPPKKGSMAAQLKLAEGDPTQLKRRQETMVAGNIWDQRFATVIYNESHNLRNDRLTNLASIIISDHALLWIATTATPLFTGPKDLCGQCRALRFSPFIGLQGQDLYKKLRELEKQAKKDWDDEAAEVISDAINDNVREIAEMEGAEDDSARVAQIMEDVRCRYDSGDQKKILQTQFIHEESIEKVRELILPIIVQCTCGSKDMDGKPLLPMRRYKELMAWSPLSSEEQAVLDMVNRVHDEHVQLQKRGLLFDPKVLVWEDFLMGQKDACMQREIVLLKKEKVELKLLVHKITESWTVDNLDEKMSTRLKTLYAILEHYWVGNPKPPIYQQDGIRNLAAEAKQPEPPLLSKPRKFIIYVEYGVHLRLTKQQMLELQGIKCVEYHGQMNMIQRAKAAETFQKDANCRVMLLSKVGGAGLNLQVASVLIFLSPVWSGLEKMQIIGRLWRLGQLDKVIVFMIVAQGGADLPLAGYAGGKSAMAAVFLGPEKRLYKAKLVLDSLKRGQEKGADGSESQDEDEDEDLPLAGLLKVKRSHVKPRALKSAIKSLSLSANRKASEDRLDGTSSGSAIPSSSPPPPPSSSPPTMASSPSPSLQSWPQMLHPLLHAAPLAVCRPQQPVSSSSPIASTLKRKARPKPRPAVGLSSGSIDSEDVFDLSRVKRTKHSHSSVLTQETITAGGPVASPTGSRPTYALPVGAWDTTMQVQPREPEISPFSSGQTKRAQPELTPSTVLSPPLRAATTESGRQRATSVIAAQRHRSTAPGKASAPVPPQARPAQPQTPDEVTRHGKGKAKELDLSEEGSSLQPSVEVPARQSLVVGAELRHLRVGFFPPTIGTWKKAAKAANATEKLDQHEKALCDTSAATAGHVWRSRPSLFNDI